MLLYVLEQGPTEKHIIEQCIRNKIPLPAKIQNAPRLNLGLHFYYIAFVELATCRSLSDGIEGRISWIHIREWCNEYQIQGEQRDDVFYHIRAMDDVYLKYQASRPRTSDPPKVTNGNRSTVRRKHA